MHLTTREVSHVTIVDINGRITLGDETGLLRDTVRQLIAADKKKIVLNLATSTTSTPPASANSSAASPPSATPAANSNFLALTKKVHDVLHVTKLYTVFDIKDDEFTAVKSFDYFFAK